jgi:hypothetical protein
MTQLLVSQIAMAILFFTNAFLFVLFYVVKMRTMAHDKNDEVVDVKKKELSKPFLGTTLDCFTNLTTELFRCGLILALTYVCEFYPFFEHSGKEYSRDLFAFVLILFFAYAFYTIKPIHDLSLLGIPFHI